jgi:hypothetical protein
LKLHEKIQNDDHDNMVKHFSKLEVDNLNLQLKYQHLEEKIEISKAKTSSDVPEFDAYFEFAKRMKNSSSHEHDPVNEGSNCPIEISHECCDRHP